MRASTTQALTGTCQGRLLAPHVTCISIDRGGLCVESGGLSLGLPLGTEGLSYDDRKSPSHYSHWKCATVTSIPAYASMHSREHARTHLHARSSTQPHTHTRTHARTRTQTQIQARKHTDAHTCTVTSPALHSWLCCREDPAAAVHSFHKQPQGSNGSCGEELAAASLPIGYVLDPLLTHQQALP